MLPARPSYSALGGRGGGRGRRAPASGKINSLIVMGSGGGVVVNKVITGCRRQVEAPIAPFLPLNFMSGIFCPGAAALVPHLRAAAPPQEKFPWYGMSSLYP